MEGPVTAQEAVIIPTSPVVDVDRKYEMYSNIRK